MNSTWQIWVTPADPPIKLSNIQSSLNRPNIFTQTEHITILECFSLLHFMWYTIMQNWRMQLCLSQGFFLSTHHINQIIYVTNFIFDIFLKLRYIIFRFYLVEDGVLNIFDLFLFHDEHSKFSLKKWLS